jgi:hypothetical protein
MPIIVAKAAASFKECRNDFSTAASFEKAAFDLFAGT